MERVGKALQGGIERIRRYSLWVSGEKPNVHDVIADDCFLRDIIYSENYLESGRNVGVVLTNEERIEHIQRIGIVSWTGGTAANARAAALIPRFIEMFDEEKEPHQIDVRIELVKTLALIASSNKAAQDELRTNGFLAYMVELLRLNDPRLVDLQKWLVYALNSVLSNNTENQRLVLSYAHMKDTLAKFQTESWFCWRRNEATYLVNVLFFGK